MFMLSLKNLVLHGNFVFASAICAYMFAFIQSWVLESCFFFFQEAKFCLLIFLVISSNK
jgi:hypothetical protein